MFRRCTVTLGFLVATLASLLPASVLAQGGDDPSETAESPESPESPDVPDDRVSADDTQGEADPAAAGPSLDLDARLAVMDEYLADVQGPTRRYFYTWLVTQTALTAAQAYVALTWDRRVVKGSYYIGTALSGASLALFLLQPKPAINGSRKFRALPDGTPEEKQAKLEQGEAMLAGQAKIDMRTTSVAQHITILVAALGSGLGVLLGYDYALKEAVTRTVGVFVIGELQIATRPRSAIRRMNRYSNLEPATTVALMPMLDRGAQGLQLAGTF